MARYEIILEKSVVIDLRKLDDDEEEILGLEWALTEIKETFNHSGEVSTFFTLVVKIDFGDCCVFSKIRCQFSSLEPQRMINLKLWRLCRLSGMIELIERFPLM